MTAPVQWKFLVDWEQVGFYNNDWCVEFDGTNTYINHGSDAALDDIHDAEFTAEIWINISATLAYNFLFSKGWSNSGWYFSIDNTQGLIATIDCVSGNAVSYLSTDEFDPSDRQWHHVVMYFNDAGDRKVYLAIDGKWASSYVQQSAGTDAVVTDAGYDFIVGARSTDKGLVFDGRAGWYRISNNDRYSHETDFTPSETPPASDANTLLLCKLDEGTGTAIDNAQGAAARDGTLTSGAWVSINYDEGDRAVSVSTVRGREYKFSGDGRGFSYPRIGRATVTLDNYDGRYDPYNASGALYGNLLPGRRFRLIARDTANTTDYNIIYGFIEDIDPVSGTDYVHISCVDDLELFQRFDLEADLLEGSDVAAIIAAILTDMAWSPASSIDDIDSDIVDFWWGTDISALRMLEQLCDSVMGWFFIANDGEFKFYSRHHSYSSVTTLTSDEVLKRIELPQPWETVKNYIRVKAYPRSKADTAGAAETLWEIYDVPYIEPTATLTFWAENYSSGEMIPAEMIAITTADYTANSASGGDSTDMTDDLTVTDTPVSVTKKIEVTNDHATNIAYLTKLESKGFPITTLPTVVIKQDTASQETYGENRFTLDNEWLQSSNLADDFANFLKVDLPTPDASPTLYIENRPDIQFLFDLFDLVTLDITALTISGDYHATYIEHRWSAGSGVLTKVKFEPSVNYVDNYWTFPTTVGEASRFGY